MKCLKILTAAALAAATSFAVAAEYTVVVLQSLTGAAAFVGVSVKDGMLLAADQINRNQELGAGNTLKVVVADDATDRAQTVALITRYAADPKVLMILGPTSSAVAVTGGAVANDLKLTLLSVTNSMEVVKTGEWANILTQPPNIIIPFIARYAADKAKVKNCTVIGITDVEVYVTFQKVFGSEAKARGVRIGAIESIKGSDSDFSALATKVANGKQDCVFLSAPAPQAANIVIQLRQAGLDSKTRIFGHSGMASPQFIRSGGKAVEGVTIISDWLPGGADDFGRAFVAAFKAKHNSEPDNFAAVGYGGMRIAVSALKAAGPNPTREAVRAALTTVKNVPVVVGQGRFSFNEQRLPQSGMNVLVVKDGNFVLAP